MHRLVAKVFRPGRNGKNDVVMHIDDNPHNNNADNLEWGTTAKNNDDAIEHGLRKNVYKVRCLETGEVYRSAREAAVKLWGKPKMGDSIIRCVKGERSKTRGLHWEVVGR